MTTWKVTIHRDDGDGELVLREDAESAALAVASCMKYAHKNEVPVKMIEVEEEY